MQRVPQEGVYPFAQDKGYTAQPRFTDTRRKTEHLFITDSFRCPWPLHIL